MKKKKFDYSEACGGKGDSGGGGDNAEKKT